jgi:hypothetical protein
VRCLVVACYALPAAVIWIALGAGLAALPLIGVALVGAAAYGCYYGITELVGRRGLPTPGRRWQVPQSTMIGASPRRRLLAWGAILGPGFLTANPYAGFSLLPFVVAAMHEAGRGACLTLAAVVGLAHGTARAAALLRDIRRVAPATASGQLDLLLKTVYWRRFDGVVLLAIAAAAAAASVLYF